MVWIGLTGAMGSGKSTVAERLRAHGYVVLDADQVVRTVLRSGSDAEKEVFKTFGELVRGADGNLDRRALAAAVFADAHKLEQLEWIIHPRVRAQVAAEKAALIQAGTRAAFYDVPLLFEKKMEDQFDFVITVSASPALRLQRLQKRTGLTIVEIEERWSRQLPAQLKETRADAVIKNNGSLEDLDLEIAAALKKLGVPAAK